MAETASVSLIATTPRSMTELIADVDPGKLPPKTRVIFSEVGSAIARGWKPSELAARAGVPPSQVSEWLAELRTALGLLNGVFPTASEDDYRALRESIARQGVLVPIVVDEHGIIDGRARARAVEDLAELVQLATLCPDWPAIVAAADADDDAERKQAREIYTKTSIENARRLAAAGADLLAIAGEGRWAEPPVDRREGLGREGRRRLAVSLNAHRRHLHRGEIRQVVEIELMMEPDRTNAEIGALVGCSGQYVGQIRQQLADEERALADPQAVVEGESTFMLRRVAEVECPHCHHGLAVLRGGKEFQLEELPAGAEA